MEGQWHPPPPPPPPLPRDRPLWSVAQDGRAAAVAVSAAGLTLWPMKKPIRAHPSHVIGPSVARREEEVHLRWRQLVAAAVARAVEFVEKDVRKLLAKLEQLSSKKPFEASRGAAPLRGHDGNH